MSRPFFTFDVVSSQGVDYLIGSTYGSMNPYYSTFGMDLQVASSDKKVSNISTQDCQFYSIVVDPTKYTAFTVYFYMVGYCYSATNGFKGTVVSRGYAQLTDNMNIVWANSNENIVVLNTGSNPCYDIFTETSKPQLFLSMENSNIYNYLYISIPGRCNGIYKVQIPDVGSSWRSVSNFQSFIFPDSLKDMKITSSTFDPKTKKFAFASKKFNSPDSYLFVFDGSTMNNNGKMVKINDNEATPIITIDQSTGNIYSATAGFGEVWKYSSDLSVLGVAVLPHKLTSVSSLYFNQTLYMVTNDADTNIGRISQDNFCNDYCSEYGYCNGATKQCACIPDYQMDMQLKVCVPSHVADYIVQIAQEQGAAAAFGTLFALAVIAGIAGWFLWFRGRNVQMIK